MRQVQGIADAAQVRQRFGRQGAGQADAGRGPGVGHSDDQHRPDPAADDQAAMGDDGARGRQRDHRQDEDGQGG